MFTPASTLPEANRRLRAAEGQRATAWARFYEMLARNTGRQIRTVQVVRRVVETGGQDSRAMEQLRALMAETQQEVTCAVCLEDLCPELKDRRHPKHMTVFQCGHHLHHECAYMLKVAGGDPKCPTCRTDVGSQLSRLEAPDAANATEEKHDVVAMGMMATNARLAAQDDSEQQDSGNCVAGSYGARYSGKCKVCFEAYTQGTKVKKHSSRSGVQVHVGCAATDLGMCSLCGLVNLQEAEHVACSFANKKLACKECALKNKWPGASQLGKRKAQIEMPRQAPPKWVWVKRKQGTHTTHDNSLPPTHSCDS